MSLPNGEYIGSIKEDKPHGLGRLIYNDKTEHYGFFDKGTPRGMGLLIKNDKKTYNTNFPCGNFLASCHIETVHNDGKLVKTGNKVDTELMDVIKKNIYTDVQKHVK
jgi:hypothetical protein